MPLRIKIQCSRISRECQEDQELDCRDMKCFECRERKWFWKHAQGVLTSIEYEVRSAAVVSLHHGQNIISCDVPCVQQHHNGPLPCTVAAQKPQKVLKRLWSAQLWGVKKKKKRLLPRDCGSLTYCNLDCSGNRCFLPSELTRLCKCASSKSLIIVFLPRCLPAFDIRFTLSYNPILLVMFYLPPINRQATLLRR